MRAPHHIYDLVKSIEEQVNTKEFQEGGSWEEFIPGFARVVFELECIDPIQWECADIKHLRIVDIPRGELQANGTYIYRYKIPDEPLPPNAFYPTEAGEYYYPVENSNQYLKVQYYMI